MRKKPTTVHAVHDAGSSVTFCGVRPAVGLVANTDYKRALFFRDPERCEHCRVALHQHVRHVTHARAAGEAAARARRN